MRWFFLFVVALNVAYIGWGLSGSSSEVSSIPPMPKGTPSITLLSELGTASKVSEADTEQKTGKKPVVVASVKQDDQAQAEKPNAAPKEDECYTLGPFRELIDLRDFTRAIKNYVKSASFRSRDEKEQTIFWVYLKPVSSQEEADALSQRLMHMKVKDHYVIKTGEQVNGISLGHFKEKNRAYEHSANIRRLGFSPVVEPVFKDYTLYWLDYRVSPEKSVPADVFKKHLTEKINQLQRQCG